MIKRTVTAVIVSATTSALLFATVAGASGGKVVVRPTAVRPGVVLPPGFVEISSSTITAPAGSQTNGFVTCPGRRVPVGGGMEIMGNSLGDNVNTSEPSRHSWAVDVNNAGTSPTSFQVTVLCERRPRHYTIASATFSGPADIQSSGSAQCPVGTVPLGGGVFSFSSSTAVNINTDDVRGDGWGADVNNGSSAPASFTVMAVCAKRPHHYTQVVGDTVDDPGVSQTLATAPCPSGTVALSGGVFSGSTFTQVNLNSSFPADADVQWDIFENNASSADSTLNAEAICASG